ncbi:hypothetical protein EON63_23310 [archaeon]|nr:MAG: hypothetical protein EON63_23310 [archaeon]
MYLTRIDIHCVHSLSHTHIHHHTSNTYSTYTFTSYSYSSNTIHTLGKLFHKRGDVYEGEFKNDVRDGDGVLTTRKGKKVKETWKLGKKIVE